MHSTIKWILTKFHFYNNKKWNSMQLYYKKNCFDAAWKMKNWGYFMLRLMCNSENLSLIELEFGVKVKAVLQGMLFWTFFQVVPFLENLHLMHKIWGKSEGKNILKCFETLQKNEKKKSHCLQHPASWRYCFARKAKRSLARINRVLKLMIGTAFT